MSAVVGALRDVSMPEHNVPALLLSGNGTQFAASVVKGFCKSVGTRKVYSNLYHPQ